MFFLKSMAKHSLGWTFGLGQGTRVMGVVLCWKCCALPPERKGKSEVYTQSMKQQIYLCLCTLNKDLSEMLLLCWFADAQTGLESVLWLY
jgi:hypothetical protein